MEKPTTNSQLPTTKSPIVVIVGETASGKSALALELAERLSKMSASTRLDPVSVHHRESQARRTKGTLQRDSQGGKPEMDEKQAELAALPTSRLAGLVGAEIICADSRTVYKGMDIGTAKASNEEQTSVPHHLLDTISPDQEYNVVNFQASALEIIEGIKQRSKLPILVGGTGLYVDSVLYNLDFKAANEERDALNPRHQSQGGFPSEGKELRPNTLVIGLSVPKEELETRITKRVEQMFAAGLEQEVKSLAEQYGWDAPAMSAVGYREWRAYFAGQQTLEQTKELITIHTRQYAKRQRSWFKRNPHIIWVDSPDAAHKIVMTFLQRS